MAFQKYFVFNTYYIRCLKNTRLDKCRFGSIFDKIWVLTKLFLNGTQNYNKSRVIVKS